MPALDNLDKIVAMANRAAFVERVQAAVVQKAVAVGKETDPDPARDGLRRSLAQRVLVEPERHAPIFAWAVAPNLATNPDVDAAWPSEGNIQFAVGDVWDAIAGAAPPMAE